jgi:hypothetical protein
MTGERDSCGLDEASWLQLVEHAAALTRRGWSA